MAVKPISWAGVLRKINDALRHSQSASAIQMVSSCTKNNIFALKSSANTQKSLGSAPKNRVGQNKQHFLRLI